VARATAGAPFPRVPVMAKAIAERLLPQSRPTGSRRQQQSSGAWRSTTHGTGFAGFRLDSGSVNGDKPDHDGLACLQRAGNQGSSVEQVERVSIASCNAFE